jgi:drug/metabolite transporter (DMT)-like permease
MGIPVNQRRVAFACLAGGVIILAFAAIFVSWSGAPGSVTALYRMLIGVAAITPLFLAREGRRLGRLSPRGVLLALAGGSLFGIDMAVWMTGVEVGGATIPTLMANTAPLWVGLGSLLILKQRQSSGFWIGLVIALAGAAITFRRDLSLGSGASRGAILGLVAAMFYASFYLFTQEGRRYLNTVSYLWFSTAGAAVALLVVNLALGHPLGGFDRETYLSFLALGLIVQFGGWLIINYAQGYIRADVVSPTLLGQPVLTALLAIPLLGEVPTPWRIVGGVVVLAGIYTIIWSRNRALRQAGGGPRKRK